MSGERDVFFRMGVMEHPQNAAKMAEFNRSIVGSIASHTQALSSVVDAAMQASTRVTSVKDSIAGLGEVVGRTINETRTDIERLLAALETEATIRVRTEPAANGSASAAVNVQTSGVNQVEGAEQAVKDLQNAAGR
jgi:hypothetical protein